MLLTLTWSKSGWMIPLLGDAFLTSAMRPGFPVRVCAASSAPMKSRDLGAAPTRAISWGRETLCLHRSTSTALNLRQHPDRLSAQAEHAHPLGFDLADLKQQLLSSPSKPPRANACCSTMFGPLIALSLRWCDDARTAGTRKPAVKTSGQADGAELCHCRCCGPYAGAGARLQPYSGGATVSKSRSCRASSPHNLLQDVTGLICFGLGHLEVHWPASAAQVGTVSQHLTPCRLCRCNVRASGPGDRLES